MKKHLITLAFAPLLCFADMHCAAAPKHSPMQLDQYHQHLHKKQYDEAFELYSLYISCLQDLRSRSEIIGIMEARMGRAIAAFHLKNYFISKYDIAEFIVLSRYNNLDRETEERMVKIYNSYEYQEFTEIYEALFRD